ncbi:phage head-tail joining protein [Acinetobacter sp. WC-743]|uniref:head-tail adaptor protein n=1 Tax=Acinetobacter sp. WC-743 TaxID=903945 RepID=UPI0002AED827|nr:head-tail adaptor protein [Acinetobacter sp. WC-743]ELW82063.1 phage head-tail joining protein [Acinetobacter sp. WC-743]
MQPGKLDKLFDVLERTPEKNSGGQVKQEWNVIGQFYGGVEPISTQVFTLSHTQGSALVCRVVMRPDDFPDLNAGHMLKDVDTNQIYRIDGKLPVNKGKQTLMCSIGKL